MWLTRTVLITMLMSLVLSACGQKGPLYFPQDPAPSTFSTTE